MRNCFALVLLAMALAGCAHKKHVRVPPPPAPAATPQPGDTETGLASWYGHPYHGRAAANGEIYDMETLVAAHRTLPFDTWVRVVNLTNDKAVEVRVIDRGPFVDGRIIDLSHAAARAIDLIGPGVAQVRIEILRLPEATGPVAFAVQVGAFRDRANADRVRTRMAAQYGSARLVLRQGSPAVWRVLVGSEPTEEAANALSTRIRAESSEKNAFVVRLDVNASHPAAGNQ
jgi:peptidoglycan lytic transglycosylase